MTHQPTSAEAYEQMLASGQIAGKQRQVAEAFALHGPGTSAEVLHAAGLNKNLNLMRARVTELANAGMLREMPSRKCEITGRQAIVWKLEAGTPRPVRSSHEQRGNDWRKLALDAMIMLQAFADRSPRLAALQARCDELENRE